MSGLDTKAPDAKMGSVVTHGGWLTPPQSAHESRRPSLYSMASSPSTPVHGLPCRQEVLGPIWPLESSMNISTPVLTQMPQSLVGHHASYDNYSTGGFVSYTPTTPTTAMNAFGLPIPEEYSYQTGGPAGYGTHDPALHPTLFGHGHSFDLGPAAVPVYHTPGVAASGIPLRLATTANSGGYGAIPTDHYSSPQVVMPSQLSPMDDQLSAYATPVDSQGFTSSFDSGAISTADYDCVGPPSPMDEYVGYSGGEDYEMVKSKPFVSPTHGRSLNRSRSSTKRGCTTRPSTRLPRNKGPQRMHLSEYNDVERVIEGKAIPIFQNAMVTGKRPVLQRGSDSKIHVCTVVHKDGHKCNARFERFEHLKRHQSLRAFPCPCEECDFTSKRSDNAGDHIKTHLKIRKPGRRSRTLEYPYVRSRILEVYPQQQAEKLIRNIERWIVEKEEGMCQRHHLEQEFF